MTKALCNPPESVFDKSLFLCDISDFDLAQTLDCGQAFRWNALADGSFIGVAGGQVCQFTRQEDGLRLQGIDQADYDRFWHGYLDLARDYRQIKQRLCADPVLAQAIAFAPGIRVLRQEPWEALASFIISQNNNVPRIKGIIERLCALCGEPLGGGFFAFPTPKALASQTPETLAPIRAGFRARYLIDAAQKLCDGTVSLPALATLPLDEARASLMQIVGVGRKVADCALLYGCGQIACFPVDVWIKRVVDHFFPNGLPTCAEGYEGIAQQYLFHYARTSGIFDSN